MESNIEHSGFWNWKDVPENRLIQLIEQKKRWISLLYSDKQSESTLKYPFEELENQ